MIVQFSIGSIYTKLVWYMYKKAEGVEMFEGFEKNMLEHYKVHSQCKFELI